MTRCQYQILGQYSIIEVLMAKLLLEARITNSSVNWDSLLDRLAFFHLALVNIIKARVKYHGGLIYFTDFKS